MEGNDAEQWLSLAASVGDAGAPEASPALPHLYELAMATARGALARFSALSEAEREELAQEKFVVNLQAIVSAENPRSFFITAITRAAISAKRRKQTAEKHAPELGRRADANTADEGDRATSLDMRACFLTLTPRDQQIVRAVAEGEDRDALAAFHGTSRANVDQIVARARKRWKEWQ